jgi:dTDP-4-dehydrorhamnose reductase
VKLTRATRVYIAGCGGMLGRAVYDHFHSACTVKATDIDLNAEWLSYADVRDYQALNESICEFNPDLILNLAALTDLEYCEQHQENAWLTNALGPENTALIAARLDIPLVYISTAGIVDGTKEVYDDFGRHNPISVYGKSKYEGELAVQSLARKHFVFRAGWMMGGGPSMDKKFVNKIYKQIKRGARELFVVDDKLGSPTYTKSFARGIHLVVETELYGVYNQVCSGGGSRYEVAREFVRLLGLEEMIQVTRVGSERFAQEYFAPRPASEQLVNLKLQSRGIDFMPHWMDALADYSLEFKEDLAGEPQVNIETVLKSG